MEVVFIPASSNVSLYVPSHANKNKILDIPAVFLITQEPKDYVALCSALIHLNDASPFSPPSWGRSNTTGSVIWTSKKSNRFLFTWGQCSHHALSSTTETRPNLSTLRGRPRRRARRGRSRPLLWSSGHVESRIVSQLDFRRKYFVKISWEKKEGDPQVLIRRKP